MALDKNGKIWVWGYNGDGELGDKTTTTVGLPQLVLDSTGETAMTNVKAVAAGYHYSFAIMNDGSVYSWGYNHIGQLGNNTAASQLLPVRVKGGASGSEYLED